MTSAGIRELKDNLSRYIRRIAAGERIAVTVHGRVIAELGPPTRSVRRHRPARYDDLLTVTSWIHEVRGASLLVGCEIRRAEDALCEGAARLGCIDSEGRPMRLPEALRAFGPQS